MPEGIRTIDTSKLKATVYTAGGTADKATLRTIANLIGGWTMYSPRGGWIDTDSGELVTETSTVLELIGNHDDVKRAVLDIVLSAKRHNESEVLVTYQNVESTTFDLR